MRLQILSLVGLCALGVPSAAQAQLQQLVNGDVGRRVSCDQHETALIGMLVHARDRGTTKAEMAAKAEALPENDGTRMVAMSRIDDVYLDPQLTAATLVAYRSKKCQNGLSWRDESAGVETYEREQLLRCQARGLPGDRDFRRCIHDLLETLEEGRMPAAAER
jgi:hypothetical protein